MIKKHILRQKSRGKDKHSNGHSAKKVSFKDDEIVLDETVHESESSSTVTEIESDLTENGEISSSGALKRVRSEVKDTHTKCYPEKNNGVDNEESISLSSKSSSPKFQQKPTSESSSQIPADNRVEVVKNVKHITSSSSIFISQNKTNQKSAKENLKIRIDEPTNASNDYDPSSDSSPRSTSSSSKLSEFLCVERASNDNKEYRDKIETIINCLDPCEGNILDMWKLRDLALSEGGLVSSEIRKIAWPKLAGVHKAFEIVNQPVLLRQEDAEYFDSIDKHEQDVIMRDIDRSVWHNEIEAKRKRGSDGAAADSTTLGLSSPRSSPRGQVETVSEKKKKIFRDAITEEVVNSSTSSKRKASSRKEEEQHLLAFVILTVLQNSGGTLHYYQGFHDLCAVVIINVENIGLASSVLYNIGCSHLRDAMSNDFKNLMSGIKMTLFPLIGLLDSELHDYLICSEVEPFFCLSWIITVSCGLCL